jgi:O-antigen/teichoic acid export membrane protein
MRFASRIMKERAMAGAAVQIVNPVESESLASEHGSDRSTSRRLARNIFSNWMGFAVQVLLTFFLTPFVLRAVGTELYGVWALIVGLTGYYGLLDLGLRPGVTQFLTRHLARKDFDAMNRTATAGFAILLAVGIGIVLIGSACAVAAPALFHLSADARRPAEIAVIVMSVGLAAQFALFTFSAVLVATERFDISNAIWILTRLINGAATLIALRFGGRLVALAVVVSGSNLLDYGIRSAVAFRLLPRLRLRFSVGFLRGASELFHYSFWSLTIQLGVRIISYTDALVIGAFMQAAAITPFALAVSLVTYVSEIVIPIAQVFFPIFTRLDAESDADAIRRLYLQGSRLMLLLASTLGVVSYAFAPAFFGLWVGPGVLSGNPWGSAATLFRILVVGAVAIGWQRLGCQVLLGTRRVKLQAFLFGGEGICNLALSIALVKPLGLVGVALGTTIPAVLFNVILHPSFTCRSIGLRVARYWLEVLPRPLLAASVGAVAIGVLRNAQGDPTTWPQLFIQAGAAALCAVASAAAIGVRRDERESLVARPLRLARRQPGLV